MEITGRNVLLLGGSGLCGMAVAREMAAHKPALIVVTGLTQAEAESAVAELKGEGIFDPATRVVAEWGDIFVPDQMKNKTRRDILDNEGDRGVLIDDLFGELTDDVVKRSTLGSLLLRHKPHIVVDSINTATAFAYQNIFNAATAIRKKLSDGGVNKDEVEQLLATMYFPQLIRHVQIALEAMKRVHTEMYLKIGTSGTGGMGLNIPFTHSEERPSRMLLAKSGVAGAHTLLLYLMARTPDAPAVKEIKPTAAISWKRIVHGTVHRRGKPIMCIDSTEPGQYHETGKPLEGVFIDAGENGFFSLGEFEALTALGLMEFITPEEIAVDVVREITGRPTGKDVVAALDAATSGPTYRAGVLREVAMERMSDLETEHNCESVAYEMLGPPRLSKLLFEAAILGRLFPDLDAVSKADPAETTKRANELIVKDADLRVRALSIGLPIILADGKTLTGAEVKNASVDLREANWRKWKERTTAMLAEIDPKAGPDFGSRRDGEPGSRRYQLRPGRLAAWIFRTEDSGERMKR